MLKQPNKELRQGSRRWGGIAKVMSNSQSPKDRPADSDIEVSIFGPGFGECIIVHIGGGRWIVIDSCVDRSRGIPACLGYFQDIGVDPLTVELILVTHWHDDHV